MRNRVFWVKSTIISLLLVILFSCNKSSVKSEPPDKTPWREAKFGMFIHWGLYAIPGQGEWYLNNQNIPLEEYRKYTSQFNPVNFNAKEWVKVAADAGMKYLVITAKHLDGFAMYHSGVNNYNIVDATPFAKDPMMELVKECKEAGIGFGFYYSHGMDWNEPNSAGRYFEQLPVEERDFDQYFYNKSLPQLRELFTGYGPLMEIWLDTPGSIQEKHRNDIRKLMSELQPNCLVNSRIGPDINTDGDFISCFDNFLPSIVLDGGFEVPATLTNGWGYKYPEGEPTPLRNVIGMLCDISGMGGNYLLNVGPDPSGIIPQTQVQRLKEVGDWLKVYGEAIYGTRANPFGKLYDWGTITTSPGRINIIFFEKPGENFILSGLKNQVKKAWWMHDKSNIQFEQTDNPPTLALKTTGNIEKEIFPVLVLEITGDAQTEMINYQQGNGDIILDIVHATNKATGIPVGLSVCQRATVWNLLEENMEVAWEFYVREPGIYQVLLSEFGGRDLILTDFEPGSVPPHILALKTGETRKEVKATGDYLQPHRFNRHPDVISECGNLTFDKPGLYTLETKIEKIGLRKVRIRPPVTSGQEWEELPRLVMNGLKLKFRQAL